MKIRNFFILILLLVVSSSCFACTPKGSVADFTYFNTLIHIETHDFAMTDQTKTELNNIFSTLECEFDCNNDKSSFYKINNASCNEPVQVSNLVIALLNTAKEFYSFTDKKFNPAVYPLVKLWQFDNYPSLNFAPPSLKQITNLLGSKIDFDEIVVNSHENTVVKNNEEIEIDFGGILKGYAVDKAYDVLSKAGHKTGYINIGGSSLYLLSVNSLSIRHPRATLDIPVIISVKNRLLNNVAVSTSGDYEKYYSYEGVNYNHIINPLTGYPTDTGVVSATIIGSNGTFGDAISTALCLMEHEKDNKNSKLICFIKKILTTYPDCSIFAVYDKNGKKEIVTNAKQGEDFTLLDSSYSINQIWFYIKI